MKSNGIDEVRVADAVKNVILATTPERTQELEALWNQRLMQFEVASDKRGFSFEAGGFGLVVFTTRTMSYLWLLGYAAQLAFMNYSAIPIFSTWVGKFDPNFLAYLPKTRYGCLIQAIHNLAQIENEADFEWPSDTPHPKDGKPDDASGAMCFDLLCMATAYCFLHETEHVRIQKDNEVLSPHDEELQCDKFARDLLLNGIKSYADNSGDPEALVTTKRAMSIGLASFFLFTITPDDAWGGTRTHPPILNRIRALTDSLSLSDDDSFWVYMSSLFFAHLNWKEMEFKPFVVESQKDFCLKLLEAIH